MSETASKASESAPAPALHVAPAPHISSAALTTQRMMIDVLIALAPVMMMAVYVFGLYAVKQAAICLGSCLVSEYLFSSWRGRKATLSDCSAAVTGLILALSLPWSVPWYVGVIASVTAIGLAKVLFGGLGQNIFNPAMVGRAFVMTCFPAALGAAAYVDPKGFEIVTQATPLTAAKSGAAISALWPLFVGNVNGSLGETSALACILGGLYLCWRRTASWEIAAGVLGAVVVLAGLANLTHLDAQWTVLHHLLGGALLFGAFFIATDPTSSPLTPLGKAVFGIGVGALVLLIRRFSGYPEGVMYAVLLMNAVVPLINRWTIPTPLGGPEPEKA